MKILLDIKDSKAAFLIEILKNFSFVKTVTTITPAKGELMKDIKESVDELNLIKEGKLKARDVEDLISEL